MNTDKKNLQENHGNDNILLSDINESSVTINNYQTASSENRKRVDQKIYLRCDREDTVNDLKDILEDNEEFNSPVFIFLPGFLDDKHTLAVKKMAYAIESWFEDTPVAMITAGDWDLNKKAEKQKKRVERSIREAFEKYLVANSIKCNIPRQVDNAKQLTEHSILKDQIILFEQEIDISQWTDATYLCLEYFLENYWSYKIEDEQPVFIVLSLVFGKQVALDRNRIERTLIQIEDLSKRFDAFDLNIFDELNELNRGHIETFYDKVGVNDATNIISEGETKRMAQVLPLLRDILMDREVNLDNQAI